MARKKCSVCGRWFEPDSEDQFLCVDHWKDMELTQEDYDEFWSMEAQYALQECMMDFEITQKFFDVVLICERIIERNRQDEIRKD